MGSSDGGGGDPGMLSQNVQPMGGNIPVAGSDGAVTDPWSYGMFQNFLPQPPTEQGGMMPPATGLTQDMFQYRPPNGGTGGPLSVTSGMGGGGGGADAQRNALAMMMGGGGGGGWNPGNQVLGANGMAYTPAPPTGGANGLQGANGMIGGAGNGDPYAGWSSWARPFYYGNPDPNTPPYFTQGNNAAPMLPQPF